MKSVTSGRMHEHVHQIEAADQRVAVDAPEQPVGVDVVAERIVDGVGDRSPGADARAPTASARAAATTATAGDAFEPAPAATAARPPGRPGNCRPARRCAPRMHARERRSRSEPSATM